MKRKIPYGLAFASFGVEGFGRRGAPWWGLAPDGVLVMMGHKVYFRHYIPESGKPSRYVDRDEGACTISSSSNAKSLLAYWNAGGRKVRIMEGVFHDDGSSTRASSFSHWEGVWYEATLDTVSPCGNYFEATCTRKLTELPSRALRSRAA